MKGVFGVVKTPPLCSSIAFKLGCYEYPALAPVPHDVIVESGFRPCILVSHGADIGRGEALRVVVAGLFLGQMPCVSLLNKNKNSQTLWVFFFSLPLSVVIKLYLLIVVFSRKN